MKKVLAKKIMYLAKEVSNKLQQNSKQGLVVICLTTRNDVQKDKVKAKIAAKSFSYDEVANFWQKEAIIRQIICQQ